MAKLSVHGDSRIRSFCQFSHLGFRLVRLVLLLLFVLSCLACVNDLSNFKLAAADDENVAAVRAFATNDLATLANLFIHAQVQGVDHAPRQVVQERDLSEEVLESVYFAPVNVVEHLAIVSLVHHSKLAIGAAQNRCCSGLGPHVLQLVLLNGEFSKALALAQKQHRNHDFVVLAPSQSLYLLDQVDDYVFACLDSLGNGNIG